jgi:hypothetical protein
VKRSASGDVKGGAIVESDCSCVAQVTSLQPAFDAIFGHAIVASAGAMMPLCPPVCPGPTFPDAVESDIGNVPAGCITCAVSVYGAAVECCKSFAESCDLCWSYGTHLLGSCPCGGSVGRSRR